MYKWILLVEYYGGMVEYELLYFNELSEIFNFVVDDLFDDNYKKYFPEFHILNMTNSEIEDRIDEHETSYIIYENGKLKNEDTKIGKIEYELVPGQSDWIEFQNFCLVNESIKSCTQFINESKKDKFPNINKVEIDGFIVYIGRDAKSNDHLTFNLAIDSDYWMHVKGFSGSHIVIRVRENLPTKEVIKKAAVLAKKNSKSPKNTDVTVVYCQRKFVKKEAGSNPGQVTVDYINADEIVV